MARTWLVCGSKLGNTLKKRTVSHNLVQYGEKISSLHEEERTFFKIFFFTFGLNRVYKK